MVDKFLNAMEQVQLHPPMLLSEDELWLIDWVLCAASGIYPDAEMGTLMEWTHLRELLWEVRDSDPERLLEWKDSANKEHTTALWSLYLKDDQETKLLMALVPTTFRFGNSGVDCGASLKMKLSRYLRGVPSLEPEPEPEVVEDASEVTDKAESPPSAEDSAADTA